MEKNLFIKKAASAGMSLCMLGGIGYVVPTVTAAAEDEFVTADTAENETFELIKKDKNNTVNYGDVNGDGIVNTVDANLIVQYFHGNETSNFNKTAADVNIDGQIDYCDAAILFDIFSGNNKNGKLGVSYKKISKKINKEIFGNSKVKKHKKNKSETTDLNSESSNVELSRGSKFEIDYDLDLTPEYEYIFMDIEHSGIFENASVTYSFADGSQSYSQPLKGDNFVLNVSEIRKRYDNLFITFSGEVAENAEIGAEGKLGLSDITAIDVDNNNIGIYCENTDKSCIAVVSAEDAITPGDVNGDGNIDLKDVVLLRRYIADGWGVTLK